MEVQGHEAAVGKRCKLLQPIRDQRGRSHFNEQVLILRDVSNLERRMFLVKFEDGSTTFLFPNEVTLE